MRNFLAIINVRVLTSKMCIDTTKISISFDRNSIKKTPLDYNILFFMLENSLNCEEHSIHPTNLMWKLNMCPTHYKDIKRSLNKLEKDCFIAKTVPDYHKYVRPKLKYWITDKGQNFAINIKRNYTLIPQEPPQIVV